MPDSTARAQSRAAEQRLLQPVRRETQDVSLRFVLLLLGGIGACLVLMLGIAYLVFPREISDRRFAGPFPDFPRPVLQPSPRVDMAQFYAEEMRRLDGIGWTDHASGHVHIPVAQAMRAVAREGIPGWPTTPYPPASQAGRP